MCRGRRLVVLRHGGHRSDAVGPRKKNNFPTQAFIDLFTLQTDTTYVVQSASRLMSTYFAYVPVHLMVLLLDTYRRTDLPIAVAEEQSTIPLNALYRYTVAADYSSDMRLLSPDRVQRP